MQKERHLPAANTVELSQNESYGLATVAHNATIKRSENPPSVIYEEINPETVYEQINF